MDAIEDAKRQLLEWVAFNHSNGAARATMIRIMDNLRKRLDVESDTREDR